jgi:hypothetical protein
MEIKNKFVSIKNEIINHLGANPDRGGSPAIEKNKVESIK